MSLVAYRVCPSCGDLQPGDGQEYCSHGGWKHFETGTHACSGKEEDA